MKRAKGLWPDLVSFRHLLASASRAARGKRGRADVARFLHNLEGEIVSLQRELKDGSYEPGRYRTFIVHDPKRRLISAAPFRDRVVHHALTGIVEPWFEKRFLRHSYACRRGYGTHRAVDHAQAACRGSRYVLKCDIRKYFPSIDHEILKGQLRRVIGCGRTLALAGKIIGGSNEQERAQCYFPGDQLWTPLERRRGLPLGNQTSQFFANVYLDSLDQMIERRLRPDAYVRYVDDFLVFGDCKARLAEMRGAIDASLGDLRLRIHRRKSRVYRTSEGVTFLGWRLFPERLRLVRGNVVQFRRRHARLYSQCHSGMIGWEELDQRIRAWIAHADHGDTWRLREQVLRQCTVRSGVRP